MNCANHPDQAASAFCRNCGKPLCQSCQRPAQGTIFCEEHFAQPQGATPYASAGANVPGATPYYGSNPYIGQTISPGLAFLLGLIPGVGAIYNGQYAKGVIHVVILGFLISVVSSDAAGGLEPLFGFLIPLWFFYMAFEAYHTAAKRLRGEPVDEFSSILPMQPQGGGRSFPVGPILLIAFGVVFLLNTLEIVRLYQMVRYWPIFLIALGAYMLYLRTAGERSDTVAPPPISTEAGHER